MPLKAISINRLNEDARSRAKALLLDSKVLSREEANAYLHALWSFEVTREYGAEIAKRFGDAHEITEPNKPGNRLKDLYNNNAGRVLALDPKHRNRPSEGVVMEALRAGKLQIQPVLVPNAPPGVVQPRSRRGSPFTDR